MKSLRYPLIPALLGIVLTVSCNSGGGGGDATASVDGGGIGGTGVTSTGTITGFGSVFVTENEFEVLADTGISDDDNANAGEDNLRVGMVVTVRGSLNDDGTATADSITYDPNLEGPIADVQPINADGTEREVTVLGTTVILSANGTVFDDETNSSVSFDTVSTEMYVEVSGFFDPNGDLRATFVQVQDSGPFDPSREVEAKGTVDKYNGINDFELVLAPGVMLSVTNVAGAALDDLPNDEVANGLFVEVKGTLPNLVSTTISATEIEGEGLDDDEGEVEIEGIVTGFVDVSNFQVAGQQVDASGASFEPTSLVLADGLEVEVEGVLLGGVLRAEEVKLREGEIKIEAVVASSGVDTVAKTITIGPMGTNAGYLTVAVDDQTQLENDSSLSITEPFGLEDIADGYFLKVEAFDDGSGRLIATEIKLDDPDDIILQGPTDAAPATRDPVVSILGVTFSTTAATVFENESDTGISRTEFFTEAEAGGTLVKVKDNSPANGLADEVEFED